MQITPWMYLIACPLCFLAGFMDSIAGGGGLISLPAYYLAGLPPHLAAGTNKLSSSFGLMVATAKFAFSKKILLACAIPAAVMAFPGSALGAFALTQLSNDVALRVVVIVLPIAAAIILFRRGTLTPRQNVEGKAMLIWSALIGLIVGFYDGMIGPGAGTFMILGFILLAGVEPVMASGSAKVVNLSSNVAALVTFAMGGHVLYWLGLPVALFQMAGSYLGSKLAIQGGQKIIRRAMLIVLVLLLFTMVQRFLS